MVDPIPWRRGVHWRFGKTADGRCDILANARNRPTVRSSERLKTHFRHWFVRRRTTRPSLPVSGAPLPGTYVAPAAAVRVVVAVPAGPVGVHIGHVMNAFGDS